MFPQYFKKSLYSDTTLHVHSETQKHTQKTHGYNESGPRNIEKTVTHLKRAPKYT